MALVEMVMPKMGESIMEGTILNWLKKVGDTIQQDESVLEVATDKVDTEVPATHAGILKEILAQKGEIVPVGKPIAIISTGVEQLPETKVDKPAEIKKENHPAIEPIPSSETKSTPVFSSNQESRFYSP